jgi:hypothetical protein
MTIGKYNLDCYITLSQVTVSFSNPVRLRESYKALKKGSSKLSWDVDGKGKFYSRVYFDKGTPGIGFIDFSSPTKHLKEDILSLLEALMEEFNLEIPKIPIKYGVSIPGLARDNLSGNTNRVNKEFECEAEAKAFKKKCISFFEEVYGSPLGTYMYTE